MKKRIIALLLVSTMLLSTVICTQITAREVTDNGALSEDVYESLLEDMYKAVSKKESTVIPTMNIQAKEVNFTKLYFDFIERYTDCFYLSGIGRYSYGQTTGYLLLFTLEYMCDVDEIPQREAKFDVAVDDFLMGIDNEWTDMQKIIYVHDKIVMETTYDTYGAAHPSERSAESTSSYGALVDHKGVCEAYSLAFLTIMEKLDIDCKRVKSSQIGHVWNLVKCNGSWYHIDLTFDDPTNHIRCNHKYALLTDDEMRAMGDHGTDWADQGTGPRLTRTEWSSQKNPIYVVNGQFYTCIAATSASRQFGKIVRYNDDFTKTTDIYTALYLSSAVGKCHTHVLAIENILYIFTDEDTKDVMNNSIDAINDSIAMLHLNSENTIICTEDSNDNVEVKSSKIGQVAQKHDYDYEVIRASTCKVAGLQKATCRTCGYEETQAMPLAHVPLTVPGKAPTHTATGLSDGIVCEVCGAVIKAQEVLPTTGHIYDEYVLEPATCSKVGTKLYQCKLCDYYYTDDIPLASHSVQVIKAIPATCTEPGMTAGTQCSVCKKIIVEPKPTAALDHDYQIDSTVIEPATCIKSGKSLVVTTCSRCDYRTEKEETVTDGAHSLQVITGRAATCSETGLTDGKYCTLCKKTIVPQKTIDKLAHTPSATAVDVKGKNSDTAYKKVYYCTVCGEEAKYQIVVKKRFSDVTSGAWFESSVYYCVANGLFSGMGENMFSPNSDLTREQFIQVLFNFSGESSAQYQGATGFNDVPAGQWYSAAVKWAKLNNITSGVSPGQFGLGIQITREQFASLLMNYSKSAGFDVSGQKDLSSFGDKSSVSSWALRSMEWAVQEGLISGTTATTLSPGNVANRATATMIFMNFQVKYLAKQNIPK